MTIVRIEKIIYEGWGIGRNPDGKAVFVKKAVPGDIVETKTIAEKKSYDEAIIDRIIEPSPKRIYPECPHFTLCGSCDHQNISYPNQLLLKKEIFTETLVRQEISLKPEPIVPSSDEPFFYRNSIRFFFLLTKDNQITFGRHSILGYNHFAKITRCLLQSEESNKYLIALKQAINDQIEDKTPFWQLRIREGRVTNETMVEVITFNASLPEKRLLTKTLSSFPEVKSIYHTTAFDKNMSKVKRVLLYGSPVIHEKIGNFRFQISPESFFQTNSSGAKTLYDKIKEFANLKMGDRVLDLFCGTGTIGIYLSTLAKEVVGVEIVPEAIRDARDNAKINKAHNCTFVCDDSEEFLTICHAELVSASHRKLDYSVGSNKILKQVQDDKIKEFQISNFKFDVIILDPPRAGLTKRTIQLLSNLVLLAPRSLGEVGSNSPTKLIYVSCNPATFARDIRLFREHGIVLKKVQPIDMFPQTHHIECVGLLEQKG